MTPAVPGALAAGAPLAVVTPYTVQPALMDTLQVALLILVAAGATVVALTRVPVRQAVALSASGLLLAGLFLGRHRGIPGLLPVGTDAPARIRPLPGPVRFRHQPDRGR
jgi:hypothetical protein